MTSRDQHVKKHEQFQEIFWKLLIPQAFLPFLQASGYWKNM